MIFRRTALYYVNARAKVQIVRIVKALISYLIDIGQPQPEDGFDLTILTLRQEEGGGPNGPYLPKVTDVTDPWGLNFIVCVPAEVNLDYDIVSFGADKASGLIVKTRKGN